MEILNDLQTWLAPVLKSPMGIVTVAIAIVLGYLLKALPKYTNDYIPHAVIVAASWLFTVVGDRALVPDTVPLGNPRTVALAAYGAILGFVAWGLYAQVIKRFFPESAEPPKTG